MYLYKSSRYPPIPKIPKISEWILLKSLLEQRFKKNQGEDEKSADMKRSSHMLRLTAICFII